MKKYLILALAIILASSISAQNKIPVEPGVSKALAEFRASHISNISYALHFDFTPGISTLNTVLITFDFKKDTKEDLQIDFCGFAHDVLGWAIAVINGNWKKLYSLKHINEHIIVPNNLLSDGTNTIWISFRGPKLNEREDYLYTLNVPANARKLFPCFDQPDLKADFELCLTVPEEWKAISAGKQIERKWEETTLGSITMFSSRIPAISQRISSLLRRASLRNMLIIATGGKSNAFIAKQIPRRLHSCRR